ncbi:MAG: S-layer protein [Candidatus Woesearchaeota archaeon]|nr:S-layer protein [Candidatus Woesearchaeota archaeon]
MNKAIKRIIALGTGVAMLGATVLGAMAAADLSAYPKPFVQDGKFNGLIVVGAGAKTEDVIGATEVAMSLQAANVVTKSLPGTATTAVEGGAGVLTSGQKLYLTDNMTSVKETITATDLPVFLKKGTLTDTDGTSYEYTQQIKVVNNSAMVKFGTPSGLSNEPQVYLNLPDNAVYTMELVFPTAVDTLKLDNKVITIFGKEYTFAGTDSDLNASGTNGLVMYGSGVDKTLTAGEAATISVSGADIPVEVIGVNTKTTTATATIKVNGEQQAVTAGSTYLLGGVRVYVRDIFAYTVPTEQGAVRLFVGSDKIRIKDGAEIRKGSVDIDGTAARVSATGGTSVSKIRFDVEPYGVDPEVKYLKEGKEMIDPIFGTFKVSFTGPTPAFEASTRDSIKLMPTAEDKAAIEFTNRAGQKYSSFNILAGNETSGGTFLVKHDEYDIITDTTTNIDVGDFFVVTPGGGYSHIFELKKIDTSPKIIRVKDAAVGGETKEISWDATSGAGTLNVDGYDVTLIVNDLTTPTKLNSTTYGTDYVYTKSGAKITLPANNGHVHIREETDYNDGTYKWASGTTLGNADVTVTFAYSSQASTYDMQVNAPTGEGISVQSIGSTYDQRALTYYGTFVKYNTNSDQLEFFYSGEATHFGVYFAPTAALTTTTGGSTYTEVQRIEVGAAVLDTEVADYTAQNVIVVGGPCVNSIAAALMKNPADCTTGFEQGKAILKLYESNGKVALLVAGYSAMDTRRASRVLADYSKYKLAGAEMEVTGTTMTDIAVAVPQTA